MSIMSLAALTEIFAIHLQAYAVLGNHLHLVVRIDTAQARAWSAAEVVARYGALFPRTAARWATFPETIQAQRVALWRACLSDLSWFMRCLNEAVARRANREDGCTGRFWEGRFRSQALLDANRRLLDRVGIDSAHWVETVRQYHRHFFTMVGHGQRIALHCARTDRDKAKGSGWTRLVFRCAA